MRGVRGTRSDVGGGGVVIEGKAAEDGPAPPLWCFEEVEAEAIEVDCSLSWDARLLLRVLLGVPMREAPPVLDPRLGVSLVSLDCVVSVLPALRGSAIQLSSCSRASKPGM